MGASLRAAGVAAAKRERARMEKTERRENILLSEVYELQKTLKGELLKSPGEHGWAFIRRVGEQPA